MLTLEPPELPSEFEWWNVRAILTDWLFRLTRQEVFVPPGTIANYFGTTAPDGWVKADGTEYNTSKYPALYVLAGAESSPGNFRVPNIVAAVPIAGSIWIYKT